MNYQIRTAEDEDIGYIESLSVKLSEKESEEFDPAIDSEWNTSEEATEYFKQRINSEDRFALVVEDEADIVGYAVGGIRDAESYREDLQITELESMYVNPSTGVKA